MPEFRQNLATQEWIILATERGKRPDEFARTRPPMNQVPAEDLRCPFCHGHEERTPPAVLALPADAGPTAWQVRVVPNRFPALQPAVAAHGGMPSTELGPYLRREGIGHHEVIIETPAHNRDLPFLSDDEMHQVMIAYHQRYNALYQDASTEMVLIFRNHGTQAGTSLLHPHSQVVASSVVPFPVRNRVYEGQRYFDTFARCVYCVMLEYEQQDGSRIVLENEHFLAFTPYASSVPYETWLLPKHHRAGFGTVEGDELRDLGVALRDLLARLWRLLDDPDYNYVIDSAPNHMAHVPFYHWHLEIYPKLTTRAGFEIGSGIGINIVAPEHAAHQLRDVSGDRLPLIPPDAGEGMMRQAG